ncbi:virulence-associated E family protein [Oceanobacillus kimchii]|uniref:virulence-associated E family protein n=1 Tax=Oceanobacillus kimchii TaxID=746691 RepID=UPI0021A7C37C|nr:virulence-associated E family protein [Oceanobacillus kimchii]MCT1577552.1 virulence-associated E family protein [Oceanobacillus kimchii]MCT2136540.1 virulence-associated E family protein [Oceanobacillus kimchii]
MLEITFGRNRSDTNWKADYLEWPEFVQTLDLRRTDETMAEYDKLSKDKQGAIKDGPAFVGGLIRGGRRKKVNMESRWLITLDADYATDDFMMDVDLVLGGTDYLIYSTHSHRPDRQKYRLVIPADREMQLDEYAAISRKLADNIGMPYFDHTTFQVHRLMYFPSCSTDADPIFEVFEGEPLLVDDVLNEYDDWTDIAAWPRHEEESKTLVLNGKKQQDPTQKQGVVGLFCRTYGIEEGIEEFLSDQYEQGLMENRYTYIHGSSANGLEVFPDQALAYSHQDSDPVADGHSKNLFDLVRMHKFGDLDDNVKKNTPSIKYPSYGAMQEFIYELPEIKRALIDKKMASVEEDFQDDIEVGDQDPDAWKDDLKVSGKGQIISNAHNAELLLKNGKLKGVLAYDDFKNREVILDHLPWRKKSPLSSHEPWSGADDSQLRHWLSKHYDIKGQGVVSDAFTHVTRQNSFHPIHDYLESFTWDGVKRLDSLFIDYLGANDNEYVRTVTRKMFMAGVVRIYEPGTKFDEMLVLVGPQGCGKSTILAKMGGAWFSDSLKSFDSKEAGEYLQNSWVFEFGELSAMKKAEVEEVKAFVSKTTDMYRVAYDRVVSEFPRKCIFFGTTNNYDFLKDQTGNRRFWPVTLAPDQATKNVFNDLTDSEIGQIWAEAKHYCEQGESLTLSRKVAEMASSIQEAHIEDDPRKGWILEYLDTPIEEEFMDEPLTRNRVCAAEIWVECLQRKKGEMKPWDAKDICGILRNIPGWKESKTRKVVKGYGKQTVFERE